MISDGRQKDGGKEAVAELKRGRRDVPGAAIAAAQQK